MSMGRKSAASGSADLPFGNVRLDIYHCPKTNCPSAELHMSPGAARRVACTRPAFLATFKSYGLPNPRTYYFNRSGCLVKILVEENTLAHLEQFLREYQLAIKRAA